jgi:hypothetical protein
MMAILERRRVSLPVIAALVVLGLAIFGEVDPGGWMVIDQVLDHWTYAGVAIGVLLAIAAARIRTRTRWARVASIALALVLAFFTLMWFLASIA